MRRQSGWLIFLYPTTFLKPRQLFLRKKRRVGNQKDIISDSVVNMQKSSDANLYDTDKAENFFQILLTETKNSRILDAKQKIHKRRFRIGALSEMLRFEVLIPKTS